MANIIVPDGISSEEVVEEPKIRTTFFDIIGGVHIINKGSNVVNGAHVIK